VLTVVTADPMTAVTGWATWAAGRGKLTLLTEKTGLDAAVTDLLAQVPWLRALPGARSRLAASAGLDVNAVDDAIDARTAVERAASIDRMAGHDLRARVSGWLLSALRDPWSLLPDLTTAPVHGGDLLSIVCELAPITVMFHHPAPPAPWVERAIQTASELVAFLPRRAVAVGAPSELVAEAVRANPESSALALARQGVVPLASRAPRRDGSRTRAELALHAALTRDARTTGMFEPSVPVPTHDHERPADVDLFAKDATLAIEIDDWYRFRDPQAYRRDRIKDIWLQRAGFFVMRFLADDVEDRLEQTIDEIAIGLAGRRASGSLAESSP
jgi:very-short-patch-repair endonuclease